MNFACVAERALLGLDPSDRLPGGGVGLTTTVRSGSNTAGKFLSPRLASFFVRRFGLTFVEGSLNLWADSPVVLPAPLLFDDPCGGASYCPVVVAEVAVGLVRRTPQQDVQHPEYLEVFATTHLRMRLRLDDGQRVAVRLLPGSALSRRGLASWHHR